METMNEDGGPSEDVGGSMANLDIEHDLSDTEGATNNMEPHKFANFATSYFREGVSCRFTRTMLEAPLLPLRREDRQAALAVWITILRFMGDMADKTGDQKNVKDTAPVMSKIYASLGRNSKLSKVEQSPDGVRQDSKDNKNKEHHGLNASKASRFSLQKKFIRGALKGKAKKSEDFNFAMLSGEQKEVDELLMNRPTTSLEKVHYIVGNAIVRPDLRDEVYCQICKQLTQNPDRNSHARGWILLSLCTGCFVPSKNFLPYLHYFIVAGPPRYAPFCQERLQRTLTNGNRNEPPGWLEFQGCKTKRQWPLLTTLMNGQTKTLLADSSTTAREFSQELSQKLGLRDQFGFSLLITAFDKVTSLGNGGKHVMDAISQYEQIARERGFEERNAPWRLFFRKEYFSPWHDSGSDAVATNLIYHQVVRGIKFGEYRIDNADEMARLAAQQYYIEHDLDMKEERLKSLLPSYIPDHLLHNNSHLEQWVPMVIHEHSFLNCASPLRVKEDVVELAVHKWPRQFSRFFEAYPFAGPIPAMARVCLAVNAGGFYVVDAADSVMLELAFSDISSVSCSRTTKTHGRCVTIATANDEQYVFTSAEAKDICDLLLTFNRLQNFKTNTDQASDEDTDGGAESHVDEGGGLLDVPVGGMALRYKVHDFMRYFTESAELVEDISNSLFSLQS